MRSLDDIVIGNRQWESYERRRSIEASRRATLRAEQIPWQMLRAMWGPGPSNQALLRWWQNSDATTRKLVGGEDVSE